MILVCNKMNKRLLTSSILLYHLYLYIAPERRALLIFLSKRTVQIYYLETIGNINLKRSMFPLAVH